MARCQNGGGRAMMAYPGEPLPYPAGRREEIARQRQLETNSILALHRLVYATSKLTDEAENLTPKEIEL
jgi:hypothetical protein